MKYLDLFLWFGKWALIEIAVCLYALILCQFLHGVDVIIIVIGTIAIVYYLNPFRFKYKPKKISLEPKPKIIGEPITIEPEILKERVLTKNERILVCEVCKKDDFHPFIDVDGRTVIICSSCGWKRFN